MFEFIKEVIKRVWKVALGLFLLPFGAIIAISYIVVCLFTIKLPTLDEHSDLNSVGKLSVTNIKEGVVGG